MSISSVHQWSLEEHLLKSQINTLDSNMSSRLDKREDYTDTLASTITVDGYVEFSDGAPLSVFATQFSTTDADYLRLNCSLVGDGGPLALGLRVIPLIDNSTTTLTAAESDSFVIKFTGIFPNVDNKTYKFPDTTSTGNSARYTKIIDNQSNQNLLCKTVFGSKTLVIAPGEKWCIYCDGAELRASANYLTNNTPISKQVVTHTGGINQTLYSTSSNIFSLITNPQSDVLFGISFTDVQVDDFFEINVSMNSLWDLSSNWIPVMCVFSIQNIADTFSGTLPSISDVLENDPSVQYYNGNSINKAILFYKNTMMLSGSNFNRGQTISHIRYFTDPVQSGAGNPTVPIDGTLTFGLAIAVLQNGGLGLFTSPVSMAITQYRPIFQG